MHLNQSHSLYLLIPIVKKKKSWSLIIRVYSPLLKLNGWPVLDGFFLFQLEKKLCYPRTGQTLESLEMLLERFVETCRLDFWQHDLPECFQWYI